MTPERPQQMPEKRQAVPNGEWKSAPRGQNHLHKTHRLVGRDKNISRHQFHEISVLMFEPQIILLDSGWK